MANIGIDTGGTFTDVVVYEPDTGAVSITKVPSTPDRPERAVSDALAGLEPSITYGDRVVHGTTVATNALLQRSGARLALLTTAGFRDTLEIGRTRRTEPGLFDTKAVRAPPLIPRWARLEINERMSADGSVRRVLDETDVGRVMDIIDELHPDAIVICLLHAYSNPTHERRLRDMVSARFPHIPVQLSSDILPEYREFERLSTTVINAYVLPCMSEYLTQLASEIDVASGGLFVMGSNGGMMTVSTAAAYPARTFLSGPAGGVQGAIVVAETAGVTDLITCDMGGTSTDVSFVHEGTPAIVSETTIVGLPLRLPQVEINTVGAGGGSIAWIDAGGGLRIGPQSAGAVPGPACYGRGGEEVTVTDASLHLGRLGADTLLGGRLHLEPERATAALTRLARKAGFDDVDRLAEGVIRLAVARMTSAIREVSIERGHDPRGATLVPMGGAGPMYAADVAAELGLAEILVPLYPGNLSALGLLAADVRYDLSRTWVMPVPELKVEDLQARLQTLCDEGLARLREADFNDDAILLKRAIDMRYRGQAFELTVPIHDDADICDLVTSFESLYERSYSFKPEGKVVELVAVRVTACGKGPALAWQTKPAQQGDLAKACKARRAVYLAGAWRPDCAVYVRERLGAGAIIDGPAIVEEFGSTTVLPPGWRGELNRWGHIALTRA
jgi:N-methylhydantoinase A